MRVSRYPWLTLWLMLALLFVCALPAHAQLVQSFYNITNIKTDVLPNAVRITVETDGNIDMGVAFPEFVDTGQNFERFNLLTIRRFRLRFVNAKAKVPAFVEIGKYPVDAVSVTLARDKFPNQDAFFNQRGNVDPNDPTTPCLDLEFRFYVPTKVPYFTFEFGSFNGWSFNSGVLNPLETSIQMSADKRSVIITILSDRVESNRNPARLKRSPPENWQHHLKVTAAQGKLTVDALHMPLSDVLNEVAKATKFPLAAQPEAAERDTTLFAPNIDLATFLQTLTSGYGLLTSVRPETEGGGVLVGMTGTPLLTERVPVRFTSPDRLRLLFPDFLLPALRADTENNALIINGNAALIERVKADIARLDTPPAMVRVEAQAYEISDTSNLDVALSGLFAQGKQAFDTASGTIAVNLTDGQRQQYQASLAAIVARGKGRIAAKPSVVVQSGNKGTLFFGQTRFLQVLVGGGNGQNAQVIQIPVGTTITVTPTATSTPDADILLDLSPRFSTVDATEVGTGLPTLGIREFQSTLRIKPGDTILIAGLLSESDERSRRGIFGFGARRHAKSSVALAVFVTAKRVTGG